ncbi:MAG: hypothetical protein QOI66_206, partial [Myxococcales bacterium]|nr:hypothetical protein [Myxococcales bacterium]
MKRLSRRTMMKLVAATPLAACGGAASSGSPPPATGSTNTSQGLRSITCDVCVLGAGASGMYATMRLRERGHSVTLLERSDRVGGHANTYRDPEGRGAQEMGVRIYPGIPIIKDTFDRYGIALKKIDLAALSRTYIDIRTGERSTYQDPNPLQTFASLTQYGLLMRTQYAYISKEGYQLPTPVPDELLQPFGQFLRDQNL